MPCQNKEELALTAERKLTFHALFYKTVLHFGTMQATSILHICSQTIETKEQINSRSGKHEAVDLLPQQRFTTVSGVWKQACDFTCYYGMGINKCAFFLLPLAYRINSLMVSLIESK